MIKTFTIDNKKFKNEFYNSIIDGIKLKYNEIYPNENININYKMAKNKYTFLIYKDMNIISNDNTIIKQQVLLIQYTNIEAINLFSNISMERYLEEYDDSKKDYRQQLKEYIDSIIVTYKLLGLEITSSNLESNRYHIFIYNNSKLLRSNHISGYFNYDIITKDEYIKAKRNIKNKLQKIYDKKR